MKAIKSALLAGVFAFGMVASSTVSAEDLPYGLKSGKPYDGTVLNVMSVVTPQFTGYILRDKAFEEMTGITVNWTEIPFAGLQEKVASVGVAADGNFDVVNYLDSWGPANAHWLTPLDEWLERDGVSMDRYPAAFAKSAMFEGKVMGFPLRAHPQLMFYRADVFEELGLEPPSSWEGITEAATAIRESGKDIEPLALYYHNDGNRQNLFIWLNFLWAAGADIFDDEGKPAWTTEAGLQATRDYVALHTGGSTHPGSVQFVEQDARVSFQQGKSAMIPVWWWAYSPMTNPDQSVLTAEQVAFTGMPTYQGETVSYAISMPYSVSQHSKNPEAAWEFMKWLSNPDLDKLNAIEREVEGTTIINNVVTHISSLTDPEVNAANNNIQQAAWESLENSDIMPQIPEWPEIGDLLSSAIAQAAAGGDTDALMTEAAERADKLLRRAGYY